MHEFDREGIVTTRAGQSEIFLPRKRLNLLAEKSERWAAQNIFSALFGLLLLSTTLYAQVLTPEILATVPILPAPREGSDGTPIALSGKCAAWRDILVGIAENGSSLVFWEQKSGQVIAQLSLPSELTPLSHFSLTADKRIFGGIVGTSPPYSFVELELTGTAKGGYRLSSVSPTRIPLVNPDGTIWHTLLITGFAISPDRQTFWVAAREPATTVARASMWKFRKTQTSRGDLKFVSEEVFQLHNVPFGGHEVAGLAWWPTGLLVATVERSGTTFVRPSVSLNLLPWGDGRNVIVIAERMARGFIATDLADSPSTLWLVLRDPANGTHALAPIPKVYTSVR
ncbi:MAG: hypothetical protein N2Z21_03940 [Candidatus Sumerlaeaceae bacterium]|nr:hypothetical protein [Candidatus Sumerlaeaceae bacterium]